MKRAIIRVIVLASLVIVFCGCHKSTETDSQVPTHVQDAQGTEFESPNSSPNESGNIEARNDWVVDEAHHVNQAESVMENADGISADKQKPFRYTIVANQYEETEILVSVDAVNGQYPVKFDLDCESDGVYEFTGLTENHSCIYKRDSGKHQISVMGEIPAIQLCGREPKHCSGKECGNRNEALFRMNPVISVDSWGDIQWKSMSDFAANCVGLEKIPEEAPDLRQVKDMSRMLLNAVKFNRPLEHWDVSSVTDMSAMFYGAKLFNQPLGKWRVSNVTEMKGMFTLAESFNQPLEKWDVSNVRNMLGLFMFADAFNQPLEKWNVSNVTDMSGMFFSASSFNQPLDDWHTSHVTNMNTMFKSAYSFNQPLEKWDVSNVKNMEQMFYEAESFNQPLGKWDVSNVTNMDEMFYKAINLEHYPDTWVVPKRNSKDMFTGTKVEKQAKQKPLKTRKVK